MTPRSFGRQPTERDFQRRPLIERMMEKIRADDNGCWLWQGTKIEYGYGRVFVEVGVTKLAHRAMYEIARGPIPPKYVIDHLCRVPACVNPDHLEAVTNRENVTRGHNAAMAAFRAGTCLKGHPKSESYRKADGSTAYCRICRNERRRGAA